jgi:plasmid maintenance system antidote protein VapI
MKRKIFKTEKELLDILKAKIKFGVSQTKVALELSMSVKTLNGILKGRSGISDRTAEALGYRKLYVKE